jgi:hypothetical protein
MLSKLVNFEDKVTLIGNTGVQFLDFGLRLALRRELPGEFVPQESNRSLARLEYDERNDRHYHPQRPGVAVKSRLTIAMDASARLFDGLWFPIPLLRLNPPRQFAQGPETWARARLVALTAEEVDADEETHRLTLALDTSVFEDAEDLRYLAPTATDVRSGVSFAFAHRADEIGWFPELPWVSGWLDEIYSDRAGPALRLPPEDQEADKGRFAPHGHYLNLLALIGAKVRLPEIKLLSNAPGDLQRAIPVDMVLDVGNSRTCGVLIEDHPKDKDGLSRRYELELRDLTRPHRVYSEPFESRVEFAQAALGKEHWAHKSGRAGAFLWPTIARVGPEAARLAARRRGTEGATGISSPKRYLWDEERFDTGWRFNSAYVRSEIEPRATAAPFCNLINEHGDALFELPEEERMPVFSPHYARSSTMMFMLAEVLTQAQCQINGPSQRLRMPNADLPRRLRSVILTVPPSMPKPEREILSRRVHQALGLVWKALGWHPEEEPIDGEGAALAWPPFPRVEMRWDEATCGQVVYLYSESQNGFAGRPDEFFNLARRDPAAAGPPRLTLATVDIGGGTTDLVVNDYVLAEGGGGANAYIVPEQRFRDGFKVAGDDILLDIVRAVLVPALQRAMADAGVVQPAALLSRLIGFDPVDVQEGVLRQQLALQVLYPVGLALLKRYEQYDPVAGAETRSPSIAELLTDIGAEPPTASVLAYFSDGVRWETGGPADRPFDLLAVTVSLDLGQIHRLFMEDKLEIGRSIRSLCEIIHLYNCDVLLITGRPSRLPGIQSLFRALLPLPPDRIVSLHGYRTGTWYPFNRHGCIQDPKTTAAVGAMLCVLGQGRLPNFFFRAQAFRPYSTVRYLGLMDHRMIIKDDSVFYREVDLDDPDYELPGTAFPMLGIMRIGYRQLEAERWGASPLYVLDFADKAACERLYKDGGILRVRLERVRAGATDRLRVAGVDVEGGRPMGRGAVALKLNTLAGGGPDEDSYWVDSGSIYR